MNIYQDAKVICNIFTDAPRTGQRISWKNVQLATEVVNGKKYERLGTGLIAHFGERDKSGVA